MPPQPIEVKLAKPDLGEVLFLQVLQFKKRSILHLAVVYCNFSDFFRILVLVDSCNPFLIVGDLLYC